MQENCQTNGPTLSTSSSEILRQNKAGVTESNETPLTPRSLLDVQHSQLSAAAAKRKRPVDDHDPRFLQQQPLKRIKAASTKECLQRNTCTGQAAERSGPVECWVRTGLWPPSFSKMNSPASENSNKRRRSSTPSTQSYSSREREKLVPPAHTAAYEEELQRHGIMFDDMTTKDLVVAESKSLCEDLLKVDNLPEAYNSCSEETFIRVFSRATKCNEERVRRDLTPHIVPSAELLHLIDGEPRLENIREEMSVDWKKCSPMGGTQPRPDGAFGLSSATFSEEERVKMENYTNIENPTKFTESLYFPFLLYEAKCDKRNISEADRQNIHSASIAVRALIRLCRASGEEHAQRLSGRILVFSISHDHERVKIYGHFALIREESTTFHRYYIHDYSLDGHYGRDRNIGSNFTRALYRDFYPTHLKLVQTAIARLPDPRTTSMTSVITISDDESQSGGQSSRDVDAQPKSALRRAKSQGSQKDLTLMKQTMANMENMYKGQLEQQQKLMQEQKDESRRQMEQMQMQMERQQQRQKDDSRRQMEQMQMQMEQQQQRQMEQQQRQMEQQQKQMEEQREDSHRQIALLERLLDRG